MLDVNQIHHADAFEAFSRVEDGIFDLIVCDGPYGVTTKEWDKVGIVQEFNLSLIRIFSSKLKEGERRIYSASPTA